MTRPESALPPSANFDAGAVRRRLAAVAARGLSRFMVVFSLLLFGVIGFDALLRPPGLGLAWLGFGALTLAAGLGGALLLRLQRARAATTLMLVMVAGGIAWNAWAIGLGIHSVGSSRVDLQACKLEYSIVSPK